MVRMGICAWVEQILDVEELGFDYLEGNMAEIASLREERFRSLAGLVHESRIKCEVMWHVLPDHLLFIGPDVNLASLHNYLEVAFRRSALLGTKVIAFSCTSSRKIPADYPLDKAWRQMGNFMRILEHYAADYGIIVAIEPINRRECTLIRTLPEAYLFCSLMDLPHIRIMMNTLHMVLEGEKFEDILLTSGMLSHVHVSGIGSFSLPKVGEEMNYAKLFRRLLETGYGSAATAETHTGEYSDRISIKAPYKQMDEEVKTALAVLTRAWKML